MTEVWTSGISLPGVAVRMAQRAEADGFDGWFVVDSQKSRLQENVESLQSMRENLRGSSGTSEDIPIVVQYNKRDLPDILAESELEAPQPGDRRGWIATRGAAE